MIETRTVIPRMEHYIATDLGVVCDDEFEKLFTPGSKAVGDIVKCPINRFGPCIYFLCMF